MRVTKLTVGKGKKIKLTEKEEQRTYFQLEMEITDQNEVERARAKALKLIEKWLKEPALEAVKPK